MWLTVARTSAIAAAVARQRAAAAGGEHAKHPTDPLLVDVLRVETSIRLLMLTGCRLSEIQKLRWEHVDLDSGELRLRDAKTGPRAVPLGEAARALIEALPGARKTDAFLFPRHAGGRGEWSLTNCWRTVCADAELGRLRLHDLRHTAASQAVMAGKNLPLVSKLLGHKRHRTTADYAHLADKHLVEAAERVGRIIVDMMACGIRSRSLL